MVDDYQGNDRQTFLTLGQNLDGKSHLVSLPDKGRNNVSHQTLRRDVFRTRHLFFFLSIFENHYRKNGEKKKTKLREMKQPLCSLRVTAATVCVLKCLDDQKSKCQGKNKGGFPNILNIYLHTVADVQ